MNQHAPNRSTTKDKSAGEFSLIDRLKCFNAKERYWVVREALGSFHPTEDFVKRAATAAGVAAPTNFDETNVFLAMDYHLNWLLAALTAHGPEVRDSNNELLRFKNHQLPPLLAKLGGAKTQLSKSRSRYYVENSQEDVDLLLAYERPALPTSNIDTVAQRSVTQIILIEAKCTSGFTPHQLESKAARLKGITDGMSSTNADVDLKLILMSPNGLQLSNTLVDRITFMRTTCELGKIIPPELNPPIKVDSEQKKTTISGWMDMNVFSPDRGRWWYVKLGRTTDSQAVVEDVAAPAESSTQNWPVWHIRRRRLFGKKAK